MIIKRSGYNRGSSIHVHVHGNTCSSDPLVACCNEFALCMLWSGADQKPLTLEDDNYSHVFAKFPNSFLQNNVHDIQFVEKKIHQ